MHGTPNRCTSCVAQVYTCAHTHAYIYIINIYIDCNAVRFVTKLSYTFTNNLYIATIRRIFICPPRPPPPLTPPSRPPHTHTHTHTHSSAAAAIQVSSLISRTISAHVECPAAMVAEACTHLCLEYPTIRPHVRHIAHWVVREAFHRISGNVGLLRVVIKKVFTL